MIYVNTPSDSFLALLGNRIKAIKELYEIAGKIVGAGYVDPTTLATILAQYYLKTETDDLLAEKESINNKITSISSSSTDAEYPSAKAVYDALNSLEVDDTLSSTSENPVQNKVVKEALDLKIDVDTVQTFTEEQKAQARTNLGITSGDVSDVDARLLFAEKSFGKYSSSSNITLVQTVSGKYVNVSGTTTSESGYGISEPFTLNAGDILLVPSAQAVPASVSVVARIVTRTFDKVINYTYTYRTDYPELPLTATADYDSTLVYTAVYDETGDTPALTGWTIGGTTVTTLPSTHEVTESYYEPLVKQSVSAMPSTGYYIYLCPTAMTVVISGLTATVNGGICQVVGWGIFKNICSNFVGAPGQAVIAQAFAQMEALIEGVQYNLENMGTPDFYSLPTIGGQEMILRGSGAPSVVPMFIGQRYHDYTNKKIYEAIQVTNSTNDWVLLN